MPVYKINSALTSPENLAVVIQALTVIAAHAPAWNYSITAASVGTGGDANKLRLNISITLTADQLAHLGLTI